MASLYRKPCVDSALSDEGYESDGLYNKYAERLDQCDFFTGCGKKNGSVDYCAIAYCYWLFLNVICDDHEPSDDERKWAVHWFMYQSDTCCTAAGCTQQANVYKEHNAWSTDFSELAVGHQIFFKKSNGAIYHTGMCVDWDDNGFWTIEANVDSYHTKKRYYKYSDPKIAGFGIPRFDGYELKAADPEPIPEPTPSIPEVQPNYRVQTNGGMLRLREEPNTSSDILEYITNGTLIHVDEIITGETVNYCSKWAHVCYNGLEGYVSRFWIVPL